MNDYECEAQNNKLKVGYLLEKKAKTITKMGCRTSSRAETVSLCFVALSIQCSSHYFLMTAGLLLLRLKSIYESGRH
jgi:hypothetical protein